MIRKKLVITGLILLTALIFFRWGVQGDVLHVPECIQEASNWCWAGSTASVLGYYGRFVAQCVMANYARLHSTAIDYGSKDCCLDPYPDCNKGNFDHGGEGSVQSIMEHWGVESEPTNAPLMLVEVKAEVKAARPFLINWDWDSGGGHLLVGHGLEGEKLYVMDPWIGEGKSIIDYEWVVSGGGHRWVNTMVMTTEIPKDLNITIQAPVRWERVYGRYPIQVNASAPTGIHYVEFYVDHKEVGTDSTPPYSHAWNTMNYSNNKHAIAAVVVDKNGRRRTTATEVFVKNVSINLDIMREGDHAWLIKRDYAMITFIAENMDTDFVDSCILYRKDENGTYQPITSFPASVVSGRTFVHRDGFLTIGKAYSYKAEVIDKKGQIIATSPEVVI